MADPARPTEALLRLDELTRRLRVECPWDREQDDRSIVPHTIEEAYELADAVHAADDAKVLDELGDVLFQVHFLALLLEERGAGTLADVADHCSEKLIRRHPHVFGDLEAADAAEVRRNWDLIKRTTEGRGELFGDLPENLPALLRARRAQRRAASTGFDFPGPDGPLQSVRDELVELEQAAGAGRALPRGRRRPLRGASTSPASSASTPSSPSGRRPTASAAAWTMPSPRRRGPASGGRSSAPSVNFNTMPRPA